MLPAHKFLVIIVTLKPLHLTIKIDSILSLICETALSHALKKAIQHKENYWKVETKLKMSFQT